MRTRHLVLLAVGLLAAGDLAAQRSSLARRASPSGFGNVVFPGTGGPPRVRSSSGIRANPPRRGSGGHQGHQGGPGRGALIVPWVVPVGGYYPYAEPEPVQQEPNVTVVVPQQPPAQVIINQNFAPEAPARPVVREYEVDPSGNGNIYESRRREVETTAAPPEERRSYLLAFKNHTIYIAFTYWLEGDTLHYVTNDGIHNQISLDLVDVALSTKLNRERAVDFHLPRK